MTHAACLPRRAPSRWTLVAACATALLASGGARAATGEAEVSVSGGVGLVFGTEQRGLFGQYNDLRRRDAAGLLGFEYGRHDDETGRSMQLVGRSLLGGTRELDLRWKMPGDWKISARLDQQVRHDPNDLSTGADLRVERTELGLGLVKVLGPRWRLEVDLRTERKEGQRLFGIGMVCPSALAPACAGTTGIQTGSAVLLLPEPVDAHHTQVQARFVYAFDGLALNGGYYGSYYRNALGSLNPTVPGTLNNAVGNPLPASPGLLAILRRPVALAPDNQAHQIDVAGHYAFTPATSVNFSLSHGRATQTQDFAAAGFADGPAGVTHLGGRVDTTRAQVALASRPSPKLSLHAKLRYEDRDDRTPLQPYGIEGTTTITNRRLPLTRTRGEVAAHYQFDSDLRGTLGADIEKIDRGVFTPSSAAAGISALRQETEETGVRVELRRRMNEDFSGSIGLSSHRRDGSNWLRDNSGLGVTEVTDPRDPASGLSAAVFMPTLADRQRDQARLSASWQPDDALSLQLSAHHGRDRFSTPSAYGLRASGADLISLDANYVWSLAWSFNGYLSYANQTLRQARPGAAVIDFDNRSATLGLGFVGKVNPKLHVGGQVSFVDDRSVYAQTADALVDGASAALLAASGGLPDIVLRQALWRLYARYELDKRSEFRVDLLHQASTWTDWAWGYAGLPFRDAAGNTYGQPARQSVGFVGLTYVYRWP